MKNLKSKLAKHIRVALILTATTLMAASPEFVELSWQHQSLTQAPTITFTDPKGNRVTVTNPPCTFYIYQSTNSTDWSIFTNVTATGSVLVSIDPTVYRAFAVTASNSVFGESGFSPVAVSPAHVSPTDTRIKKK